MLRFVVAPRDGVALFYGREERIDALLNSRSRDRSCRQIGIPRENSLKGYHVRVRYQMDGDILAVESVEVALEAGHWSCCFDNEAKQGKVATEHGGTRYFLEPFDLGPLVQKIAHFLGRRVMRELVRRGPDVFPHDYETDDDPSADEAVLAHLESERDED